jgi:hypothetical protein
MNHARRVSYWVAVVARGYSREQEWQLMESLWTRDSVGIVDPAIECPERECLSQTIYQHAVPSQMVP